MSLPASHKLFFVVALLFLNSPESASASEEADALLRWKSCLRVPQDKGSMVLSSWASLPSSNGSTHATPCTWFGVSCNGDGSIVSLNLSSCILKGTLYEFPFSSFPNLTLLDLNTNEFFGSIPPGISHLSKLVYLDLSINQFSGEIPREIGLLTDLDSLYLHVNKLSSSIPSEIGKLKLLENLNASRNNLSGPIPESLGRLESLATLSFFGNKLSGAIPRNLGNLKSLVDLDMGGNQLRGSIPASLGNLSSLTRLHLSENELSGPIPSALGNLKSLIHLEIGNNKLNGSIPLSFRNLSNLQTLSLYSNQLSGPIPTELHYPDLLLLNLCYNRFSGYLPEKIFQAPKLQSATASHNLLTGTIPRSLKNSSSLIRFSVVGNMLTGNISESFGIYLKLKFINLNSNNFYGELSENWGKCKELETISISHNNITGKIPPELGDSIHLRKIDFSSNHLVGEIPKEVGRLKYLLNFVLSDNQISDTIPEELGLLTDLYYLDISSNKLNGLIPKSLGDCLQLYHLNLSYNNLNQEIPGQMSKLLHLTLLDLSHNQFTGKLTLDFWSLQSLENLNLSHNLLSGLIPMDFVDMNGLLYVDVSYNQLQGPIPKCKAFTNASMLQGNRGLCGDIAGFQPCKSSKRDRHLIFVLSAVLAAPLVILWTCIGVVIVYRRRNRRSGVCHKEKEGLFCITSFDGKAVYEEILNATNNFDAEFCIGEGGQGTVYMAKLQLDDIVAVKKLHSSLEVPSDRSFLNEVTTLTNIRHRNIVKLHGFCSHTQHSLLIYEYLEGGSLAAALSQEPKAMGLDWPKRINIIKGVAEALSYMHHDCSPPIIHRDISSKNVLLYSEDEAHLSDFGTAKFLKLESSNWSELVGTYGYVAPEFAYTMKVTEKCDVYSFGVLALEVIKGEHTADVIAALSSPSANQIDLKDVIDHRLVPPSQETEKVLNPIILLVKECLKVKPETRPTMYAVSRLLSDHCPSSSSN